MICVERVRYLIKHDIITDTSSKIAKGILQFMWHGFHCIFVIINTM